MPLMTQHRKRQSLQDVSRVSKCGITLIDLWTKVSVILVVFTLTTTAFSQERPLFEELSDQTNVLVTVTAADLLKRQFVPESSINTTIDRRALLKRLFDTIAAGDTDSAKVEAWVRYLQNRIAHPVWPPMHTKSVMVTDPIWILQHRLGQCGQTNRVLVDGLLAAGYRARLVQLAAHVTAEAWYGNQWHYLDADWLKLGQFVRKPDGTIPSTAEIYDHLEYLKTVRAGREFELYPVKVIHVKTHQPYLAMFTHVKLNEYQTPFFYVKTATPQQEQNALFGWNYYRTEAEE